MTPKLINFITGDDFGEFDSDIIVPSYLLASHKNRYLIYHPKYIFTNSKYGIGSLTWSIKKDGFYFASNHKEGIDWINLEQDVLQNPAKITNFIGSNIKLKDFFSKIQSIEKNHKIKNNRRKYADFDPERMIQELSFIIQKTKASKEFINLYMELAHYDPKN